MMKSILSIVILPGLFLCPGMNTATLTHDNALPLPTTVNNDSPEYQSEKLIVRKISPNVYLHTSFLQTESFGKVPCNGMVVVNNKEAVVFDTPADNESTEELIRYFTDKQAVNIKGVVATHFHADCVAGLKAFHDHNIPSYANSRTIGLLKSKEREAIRPQKIFKNSLELKIGDKKVYAGYFGAGHTRDNIIGYFADEQVMFGGCLIKEAGAAKGNLADANTAAWSATVRNIKQRFPEVKTIIPGHGKPGGTELLDYTIGLFE